MNPRSALRVIGRGLAIAAAAVAMLPAGLAHAGPPLAGAATCGADFAVADGRFFTQTGGDGALGFAVTDNAQARFGSALDQLGGVPAIGFPISNRFQLRGFTVQAFQKAVLQWDPVSQSVNVANTLDSLHAGGFDDWLEAFRQVPRHQALAADDGVGFDQVIQNHLAILDANAAIRDAFLATPGWLTRLGLPIAYADFGPVRALRAQRAVLQQWTVDVPWARAGDVVFANAGDLAKEAGLLPSTATTPGAPEPPADLSGRVTWTPTPASQGSTVRVALAAGHADTSMAWRAAALPLACADGHWQALLGLDAAAELGPQPLVVRVGSAQAESAVEITSGAFGVTSIELPDELQDLLDPDLSRQESEFMRAITGAVTGPPRWTGAFQVPADGRRTSPFGERRTLQPGDVPAIHEGLDIAAPLGTAIQAPAVGSVAWTGPLRIRGNVVVVDHGFGVFSAFYHLDRVDVAIGDDVVAGQILGVVGSTGRSTGPHLHWEVRVRGTAVDPAAWLGAELGALGSWTAYRAPDAPIAVPAAAAPTVVPTAPPAAEPPAVPAGDPAPNPGAPAAPAGDTGIAPAEGPAG